MKQIEAYKISWNIAKDEGIILLQTADSIEQLLADSAAEAMLLLDILRNEKPVFYDNGLLFTGFEMVGEGETPTVLEETTEETANPIETKADVEIEAEAEEETTAVETQKTTETPKSSKKKKKKKKSKS